MESPTHYPPFIFGVALVALWLSSLAGMWLQSRSALGGDEHKEDRATILAAGLTLLAFTVGFSFSFATGRYDQRKNYEEAEANAIGTEFVRVDVLPAPNAENVRRLLRAYLDQRIAFYINGDESRLAQINQRTAELQAQLWAEVMAPAAQPTRLTSLALAGMNDVLNSQSYTQAAFWFRIPTEAWCLMAAIALGCNVLFGYNLKPTKAGRRLAFGLPLINAVAFFLIADIDAPRHGLIQVIPQNLNSLAQTLGP